MGLDQALDMLETAVASNYIANDTAVELDKIIDYYGDGRDDYSPSDLMDLYEVLNYFNWFLEDITGYPSEAIDIILDDIQETVKASDEELD